MCVNQGKFFEVIGFDLKKEPWPCNTCPGKFFFEKKMFFPFFVFKFLLLVVLQKKHNSTEARI